MLVTYCDAAVASAVEYRHNLNRSLFSTGVNMGYFMRFFIVSAAQVQLSDISEALVAVDPTYALVPDAQLDDFGELYISGQRCAEIEINRPDDEIFIEEIAEYRALLQHTKAPMGTDVSAMLNRTRAIITVEAFWKGNDPEPVLERIDPLWDWTFEKFEGLLHVDGDGFYDKDGLIFEMHVTI